MDNTHCYALWPPKTVENGIQNTNTHPPSNKKTTNKGSEKKGNNPNMEFNLPSCERKAALLKIQPMFTQNLQNKQ